MSKRKIRSTEFSVCIAEFMRLIREAQQDWKYSFDEVHRLDLLQSDYLHVLELEDLDYKKRSSLATKICDCRRRRRLHKNIAELLTPITELMKSKIGVEFMRQLNEVLGQTRKLEERNKHRIYFPRVLIQQPITGGNET